VHFKQLGAKFLSVSSDHESVPMVPGPPGVWHAADVATETQLKTKAKGLNTKYTGE